MRDPDDYKKWHIKDSLNYYHVLLNQDKIHPELFRFVIIVYDNLSLIEKHTR